MRFWCLFAMVVCLLAITAAPAEAGGHCGAQVAVIQNVPAVRVLNVRAANSFSFQSNRRGTQIQSFGGGVNALGVGGGGFSFQERRGPLGRVRSTQLQLR